MADLGRNEVKCGMTSSQPLTIVIRIPNVSLSRADLVAALGRQIDRYEETTGLAYAQIDIGDGEDQWVAALDCIRSIQSVITLLISEGSIGTPSLDIAMAFPHSYASKSLAFPAALARATGEAGIDVEISVYCTENESSLVGPLED
jgi:hypothetical protein